MNKNEIFDLKILEARNNPVDLILSQEDLEEQTVFFENLLLTLEVGLVKTNIFMQEYYQNLKTTTENLSEFILFCNVY